MKARPRVWLPLAGSIFFAISAAPAPQDSGWPQPVQDPGSVSAPPPELRRDVALSGPSDSTADVPLAFAPLPSRAIAVEPITDDALDRLIATLDGLLSRHDAPARRAYDVDFYYRDFVERLQIGRLSTMQEARVMELLDTLAARYPTDVTAIERERRTLSALSVGKIAPEIVGKDLDGNEFRLSDYRGKVVVVAFSGAWCAACRIEYPYFRLLEEVYQGRPFALLGVSSDKNPDSAKRAKREHRLTHRTWFDGGKEGTIAGDWGVAAWPTTYVLDQNGVVQFVNLRQEDLLKAVRQLIDR